jgi:hypothetical protein
MNGSGNKVLWVLQRAGMSVCGGMVALWLHVEVFAQPLNDTSKIAGVNFQRLLNTYTWNGLLAYGSNDEWIAFSTRHRLRSRLIRSATNSLQDDYEGLLTAQSVLSKTWSLRSDLQSNVLRDNRAAELGRFADHRGYVGLEYSPNQSVVVQGMGGYAFGSQAGKEDAGPAVLFRLLAQGVQLEEFRSTIGSSLSRTDYGSRRPATDSLRVAVERQFSAEARNILAAGYVRQARQFYTPASQSIQATYGTQFNVFDREARESYVVDTLQFSIGTSSSLMADGGFSRRVIDRGFRYKNFAAPAELVLDTRVEELVLHGTVALQTPISDWVNSSVRLHYQEREEKHTVKSLAGVASIVFDSQEKAARRLANIARRTVASSAFMMQLSQRDSLILVGSASILRYDTPDTTNIDDRDELFVTVGIQEIHRFNKSLRLILSIEAGVNHLVYLHRFQSANNNKNRILRFNSTVEYQPTEGFRTTNSAEVFANYTVYDFENEGAFVRSFSFRQASWVDSSVVRLSDRLWLDVSASVRLYERGILRWREFKERPQNYFSELAFWPRLSYRTEQPFGMSVGFRYFSLDRHRYEDGNRRFEYRIASYGPTVSMQWPVPNTGIMSLSGWRETQKGQQNVTRTISNLTLHAQIGL